MQTALYGAERYALALCPAKGCFRFVFPEITPKRYSIRSAGLGACGAAAGFQLMG